MKELKIAICDDEILLLPYLSAQVKQGFRSLGFACDIATYSNSRALIAEVCNQRNFDVFFLDIDIPETNGIQLAEKLLEMQIQSIIVYVSAKEELVFDTFKTHPFAFVRKSNFAQDMVRAIEEISRLYEKPADLIVEIEDSLGHTQKININQTIYIEAKDKYCKIYTVGDSELIRYTMRDAEDALAKHFFIRVHKTFLVNARFIFKIPGNYLVLDNNTKIPISRHRLKEVNRQYLIFLEQ